MKNYKKVIGAAAVGLALAAVSSKAQVLNLTGGSIAPGGTLANQELVGVSPGGNVGANNGTISTWVVSDSSLDASGLIFIYQVVNNGADAIDNVELTGFTSGEVLSTGSYSSLLGLAFGTTPSADGSFPNVEPIIGNVTFQSTTTLGNTPTTDVSDYLAVFTDVTAFGLSYGQIQDNFSGQGNILAPVPEANTVVAGALMLLPLGIGAVRALRKERTA
jgi:hypothetical protein